MMIEQQRKGIEWVNKWRLLVEFHKLDPRTQFFAVLAGAILDYGVVSECVPLYLQELKKAGLLDPERISNASKEEVEAILRECSSSCEAEKFGSNRRVPCKPQKDDWFKKSAEWLVKLGKTLDAILSEFKALLEDVRREEDGVVRYYLTPSHIYLIALLVPGIGPKKAAMVARDALIYNHELTIPNVLKNVLGLEGEVVVDRGYHTLVFIDVHALRVFERLGFLVVESKDRLIERIKKDKRSFIADQINKIITPQYVAALAYPENPGAVDLTIWYLGRDVCRKRRPLCNKCFLKEVCYYHNAKK